MLPYVWAVTLLGMGKIERHDLPPLTETGGAGRECPKCGHDFSETVFHEQSWIARLLRLKPWPASCGHSDDDYSGWSTGTGCHCMDPFHGS